MVLAVVIPSVCPSVTCVLCDKTKKCTVDILIAHETAITLVFWHLFPLKFALKVTHSFETRRLWQISAYNVSAVRDSEKSFIMRNRKLTMGFPTRYRWSAYITPKSTKGWLKKWFFVCWIKFNFSQIKCATKFLCVNTSSSNFLV